ncbi:MAG: hypothetical protein Q7J27_02855 [Syntrophales bacterium]|nr:hypothetical protein [Syntrophales bacterium]
MKRLSVVVVLFAVFMYFSVGTVFAESTVLNLKGKWTTKSYAHHHSKRGFFSNSEVDGQWIIKEQQGRFFYGDRSYTKRQISKKKGTEGFSGVISRDGKRVYIVDHEDDILIGDVLSDNSIEFIIINESEKGNKNHQPSVGLMEIERVK